VSEDAGIEPRAIATLALAIRRSTENIRLDPIHKATCSRSNLHRNSILLSSPTCGKRGLVNGRIRSVFQNSTSIPFRFGNC
jgi:hypothetical protein